MNVVFDESPNADFWIVTVVVPEIIPPVENPFPTLSVEFSQRKPIVTSVPISAFEGLHEMVPEGSAPGVPKGVHRQPKRHPALLYCGSHAPFEHSSMAGRGFDVHVPGAGDGLVGAVTVRVAEQVALCPLPPSDFPARPAIVRTTESAKEFDCRPCFSPHTVSV